MLSRTAEGKHVGRLVSSRDFERCRKLRIWVFRDADELGSTQIVAPLVAGVEYFSGLEPGGGNLFMPCNGRPLEISGLTTIASPRMGSLVNCERYWDNSYGISSKSLSD